LIAERRRSAVFGLPKKITHETDLIVVDGMAQAGIEAQGDVAAQVFQQDGAALDAVTGDVKIRLAASEKDGCAGQ
jgi:hypothetical protein